jgi:hypothetical protein
MKIQGDFPTQYDARVAKLAQNVAKQEGEAAVALIETAGSSVPPVGPNGEGSLINTRA